MDTDRITGQARNIMGRVEEGAGRLMGDQQTRNQGMTDQAIGAAQNAYGQAKDYLSESGEVVSRQVRDNPMSTVLVAALAGYALGWMMHSRH